MRSSLLSALAALLLLCTLLTACGTPALRDDLTAAALAETADGCITNVSHLDNADSDYLRFNLAGTEIAADVLVRFSVSGQSLDEYGIFKAASADDIPALEEACAAYLKQRNDAWMNAYLVEEYPKLRDAEVVTLGNYVIYLILSDAEKDAVIAALNDALTK